MSFDRLNLVIPIVISLLPFVLVGGWLFYRDSKSPNSFFKKKEHPARAIRVGDKDYVVATKSRILAAEKKTGEEVIVTTCGFEDEQQKLEGELQALPEGIKICRRLANGIFSPEESDWLAGEDFTFLRIAQVQEYEQQ